MDGLQSEEEPIETPNRKRLISHRCTYRGELVEVNICLES